MSESTTHAGDSQLATPSAPIPVTLISGFLGSGKTTLLQHILTSDHGLKIAVIVNDIGAVNVDANLIKQTYSITRTEEKVVALQNGCICCTLRGDLLEALVRLSEQHQYDYIVIESSGISEPEQVAETFDAKLAQHLGMIAESADAVGLDEDTIKLLKKLDKLGGVQKFAKLDTTATVIDAFTVFNDFETADLLSNRRDDVTLEDERTVSDLMVDQIEFADVIVVNKIAAVSADTRKTILSLIKKLNSRAKVLETNYGKADVKELLNTGKFSLEEAQVGYGWLQDIHDMSVREVNGKKVITPKPETEEYNVRSFVYQNWRPFHPRRTFELIYDKFIVQVPPVEGEDEEDDEMEDEDEDAEGETDDEWEGISDDEEGNNSMEDGNTDSTAPTTPDRADEEEDPLEIPENDVIIANKRASPLFARLFRSKGEFFLASRPQQAGNWSQAGAMLTIGGGRPWFVVAPGKYETSVSEINEMLQNDNKGEWGDRRQEIVFIGEKLDVDGIKAAFDACLLTDVEIKKWEKIMRKKCSQEKKEDLLFDAFNDGFPPWEEDRPDEPGYKGYSY